MRKTHLLLIFVFLICANSWGKEDTIGVGVIVDEPTGLCGKPAIGSEMVLKLALAWSFVYQCSFYIHGDYLFKFYPIRPAETVELPVYVGMGVKTKFQPLLLIGLRVPVSIAYVFKQAPLDVFLEVAPGINLIPETVFDMGADLGIRYRIEYLCYLYKFRDSLFRELL